MLPVPKVLFSAAISFFLESFYVADFKLGEDLLLQQFRSVFLLTNSTAYDLGLEWENSHWVALNYLVRKKVSLGGGEERERGRKGLREGLRRSNLFMCNKENKFFSLRCVCVSKEILLRHILQQYLLRGTWRVDGKWKNSNWTFSSGIIKTSHLWIISSHKLSLQYQIF